jgi:SpoVK/Ycf46/Vps4 family AAA+-type ATPase
MGNYSQRVEHDARGAAPGAVGVVDERTKVTLRPRGPGAGGMADDVGARVGVGAAEEDEEDVPAAEDESGDDDDLAEDEDPVVAAVKRAERAARRGGRREGFEALGGVGDIAAQLLELVDYPLNRPEIFTSYGITPPRGVLLWGPPGTGKTRLARAAAKASKANLLVVNGPEIIGAYVGQSEAALRGVFQAAAKQKPCVILLDELDAIAPARSDGDGGGAKGGGGGGGGEDQMSARVVSTLLTIMDGAQSAEVRACSVRALFFTHRSVSTFDRVAWVPFN